MMGTAFLRSDSASVRKGEFADKCKGTLIANKIEFKKWRRRGHTK
jgi:hypothetical protein